jgi:5-methylcytosine-specific restriction endonuclease McrA
MGFRPKPKPGRIEDKEVLRYVVEQRDGRCLWGKFHPGEQGPCSAGLDPHHIVHRGSGGGDTEENLITLCRNHHRRAHSGHITREELYAILRWYGYEVG